MKDESEPLWFSYSYDELLGKKSKSFDGILILITFTTCALGIPMCAKTFGFNNNNKIPPNFSYLLT